MKYLIFFLPLLLSLLGCQSSKKLQLQEPQMPLPSLLVNHRLFSPQAIQSEKDIFKLPENEKANFLNRYNALVAQGERPDKAIYQYLEKSVENFTYRGDTLTAPETLIKESGNCISLAILTHSYAQAAGIETNFKEVSTFPVFQREDNVILVSSHFSTKLLAPKVEKSAKSLIAIRAGTVVDYFPTSSTFYIGNAQYPQLVAKYYINLATEALLKEEYDLSYSLALAAFEHTPYSSEIINLMAIIHRRAGDTQTAKALFEFAIKYDLHNNNLIASYLYLAQTQNDAALIDRLEPLFDSSAKTPFDLIQVAKKAYEKKKYRKARSILSKLIKEYSYLPEPYFEMARLYYLQSDKEKAESFLEQAIKMSDSHEKTEIYQAKLNVLQHQMKSVVE